MKPPRAFRGQRASLLKRETERGHTFIAAEQASGSPLNDLQLSGAFQNQPRPLLQHEAELIDPPHHG